MSERGMVLPYNDWAARSRACTELTQPGGCLPSQRLASPFFHPIDRSELRVRPVNEPVPRTPGTSAPQTNREVSDTAPRKYRIFW